MGNQLPDIIRSAYSRTTDHQLIANGLQEKIAHCYIYDPSSTTAFAVVLDHNPGVCHTYSHKLDPGNQNSRLGIFTDFSVDDSLDLQLDPQHLTLLLQLTSLSQLHFAFTSP